MAETSTTIVAGGSNRLIALAADIKAEHAKQLAAVRSIGERAVSIGNMLLQAKATVPHGGWLPWLAETGLGERTAQRYMRIAKHGVKSDTVSDIGINKVLATISTVPDFDLPEPNTCVVLKAQARVAWIWPAQHMKRAGYYWLLIADLRTGMGIGTTFKKPGTAAAVDVALRIDGFPVAEAEVTIDTSGDTTNLEAIVFGRIAA